MSAIETLPQFFTRQTSAMIETLRTLVEHETPSLDKPALDAFAVSWAGRLATIAGLAVEVLPNATGGDHIQARFDGADRPDSPPTLVLCHYDTVWPAGTLARLPFRVEGERAYGPGSYDMKASLVLVEAALRAIVNLGLTPRHPIVLLVTSDEEIGSPTSRALIEDRARACGRVLVMEAPLAGGRLKTARKGVGQFRVNVRGRAAHAGVEPEKGRNALVELAHQILKIQEFADPSLGTTLNVGLAQGGTAANVVPADAWAKIDVRVSRLDEADRINAALRGLQPVTADCEIVTEGRFNRPPMERSPAVARLFESARAIGSRLGLSLEDGSTGGASDGNFTAALGLPTLDGLGALGDGAHADHEHILIASLAERAALLTALLLELDT